MEISRDFYLDKLIKRKHNGLIKVITGIRIHMYHLSFAEFMNVYNGDKYMGLSEYMLYGGISLVVLREGANDKAAVLQNLFNEIYIRDITRRNRVKKIQNYFCNHKKYLDCFEDSFLIESAQRYDIKGKAYIETPKNTISLILDFATQELTFVSLSRLILWRM